MKKTLSILFALAAMCFSAEAQWYLFPGSGSSAAKDTSKLVLTPKADTIVVRDTLAAPDTLAVRDSLASADTLAAADTLFADVFVRDIPDTVNITLLLPLKSITDKPSANFIEYYSGALMAVRDLGRTGLNIRLNTFDTDNTFITVDDAVLASSDIIIGPVGCKDIEKMLPRCPEGKYLISPLEPSAAQFADSSRVVQVPSPWTTQIDEMLCWLKEDAGPLDEVLLLVEDKNAVPSQQSLYLRSRIIEQDIPCRVLQPEEFTGPTVSGRTRVIVDFGQDQFLCKTINDLAGMSGRGADIVLYSTSKVRSLEGISSTSLYQCNTRMAAPYYVDYSDASVKEFILEYRDLFGAEPSGFAFQGYDLMHYFTTLCTTWGRHWYAKLPEFSQRGLQSDFRFSSEGRTGAVGVAVRRIVYDPDLSTTLQQGFGIGDGGFGDARAAEQPGYFQSPLGAFDFVY